MAHLFTQITPQLHGWNIYRHSLTIFFVLFIVGYSSIAQTWQEVATDNYGVAWLDNQTIIVVGDNGVIMRSEDAGLTWNYVPSGTREVLLDVHFFDKKEGFAVGTQGVCIYTNDGGQTWSPVQLPAAGTISGVDFPTRLKGWAVGDSGKVISTTDGGKTWNELVSGTISYLIDVKFIDSLTGVVCGLNNTLLQTDNGGGAWHKVSLSNDSLVRYTGIDILNDTIVVVGYRIGPSRAPIIQISRDKGKTWSVAQTAALNIYPEAVKIIGNGRIIATGNFPRATDTLGVKVVASDNGGETWQEIQTGLLAEWYPLTAIDISKSGKITAVGRQASIIVSNDTGRTWQTRSYARLWSSSHFPQFTLPMYASHFYSSSSGIVIGGSAYGTTLRTEDAGLTWHTYEAPSALYSLAALDKQQLIGLPFESGTLYTSSDQGRRWEAIRPNFHDKRYSSGTALQFLNSRDGYFGADSLVFYTSDGGASWQWREIPVYRGKISQLLVVNHNTMWASLVSIPEDAHILDSHFVCRLYRTTNGGVEWQQIRQSYSEQNHNYQSFYFRNATEGWISFGVSGWSPLPSYILHTTDGGETWDSVEVSGGTVNHIQFYSDSLGYAVGGNALIMKTTDGGKSWNREYPWPYQARDTAVIFLGSALLPGSRTIIVYGDGVLVRGAFDSPATSVPTLGAPSSNITIRVLPTISAASKRQIEIHGARAARRISLYDMLGTKVYDRVLQERRWDQDKEVIEVDLDELPSGSYRVMVTTEEGEYSAPLVVVK